MSENEENQKSKTGLTALIYKKISDVMKDVSAVGKSGYNEAQRFKFRKIDNFIDSFHPALVKNGVIIIPRNVRYERHQVEVTRSSGKSGIDTHVILDMEYVLYAEDGSSITVGPFPGEAIDSGDKATTKALTAAYKYFLIETFVFPLEDMPDADSESHDVKKPVDKPKQFNMPPKQDTRTPLGIGGDYVIPFGAAKGKLIKSQPRDSLEKTLDWCKKNNKAPEYQEALHNYLDSITQESVPPMPDDDMPSFEDFDR